MAPSEYPAPKSPTFERVDTVDDLVPYAREIVDRPGMDTSFLTTGYGMVEEGDEALVAVRSLHNEMVVEAIVRALREKGVEVDVVTVDIGPDRERTVSEDVDLAITDPQEMDRDEDVYSEFLGRFHWVEDLAEERGYDLLVETTAGPLPWSTHETGDPYAVERIIWQSTETFTSEATFFPQELLKTITAKTIEQIHEGIGGTVRITDPEGTDISFTLHEEYFQNSPEGKGVSQEIWDEYYADTYDWPSPFHNYTDNHVAGKHWPPFLEKEDASGVIASTTGHHSKPYPLIKIHVEDSRVTDIEGGGERGEKMRDLLERTRDVQYAEYHEPGMFWFWECSIGTNPKVARPPNFMMKSGAGGLVERLRSGIIHLGTGTHVPSYVEPWADEQGLPYGHVDSHLNFPTYEITTDDETITVIDKGRLTALDTPEVREAAAEYGDPDELLSEVWVPHLPGVNTDGDFDDYARNPTDYVEVTR